MKRKRRKRKGTCKSPKTSTLKNANISLLIFSHELKLGVAITLNEAFLSLLLCGMFFCHLPSTFVIVLPPL